MSLVDLVIREEVENLSNSEFEKLSTLVKTNLRRLRAKPAARRAERKPTEIVQTPDSNETKSMITPSLTIVLVWRLAIFIPSAPYSALTAPMAACEICLSSIALNFF